jgi:pilus assembly protein CpaB
MNRQQQRMAGLAGAVGLALIGTFGLVKYVQSARDKVVDAEVASKVYVATGNIKPGTTGAELAAKVEAIAVPVRLQSPGAITDLAQLEGLVNVTELLKGDQLVKARFDSAANTQSPEIALAGLLPGSNEMTLRLTPERALGGALRPGDTVSVVASFENDDKSVVGQTVTMFNRVVIVRVQTDDSSRETSNELTRTEVERKVVGAPTEELLVTVAIDQTNLPKLAFAAEFGSIWLSFEPDASIGSNPGPINLPDVLSPSGDAAVLAPPTAELSAVAP